MRTTSIVIPNWNGVEKLEKHLPTVIQRAQEEKVSEIIVVDDASTDNSVEMIKTDFPDIKLIIKSVNSGFSSTVNLGVAKSVGELVVLLNTDANPQKGFLRNALNHFENNQVFSVGCNVGGAWAGGKFENGYFWHGQADKSKVDFSKAHQTLWASGGSGIFRKEIWQELAGLDELFDPFYEEDVDLGYRATKRGYINIWEPNCKVEHYKEEGVIVTNFKRSQIEKIAQRNQLLFIWKNITSPSLVRQHQLALAKMLLQHPKYWVIFINALAKSPQLLQKKSIEKRVAKLTDEQIFQIFASNMIYSK